MSFGNAHLLWLLLFIPPALALFFWWSARTRQKLMTQFIQSRLLPGLTAGVSPLREKIRATLLISAVSLLIIAVAGPQIGYDLEEARQRGLDIVVAIDTSKSMLAEDIAPNRLTRAKYAALDLMQQAKSDRLGLVAFAGTAFLQCPLTIDDSAFRQSVDSLNVDTLPEGGSALAEAIRAAQTAFKEGENHRILVLFSDGEDHDSAGLEAAKAASQTGMRIFTIGIGSPEGELLRIKTANGQNDYVRDENGNVVKSHLNEHLLREIAGAAGGFYLPLRGARSIDMLYENGLAPLPKSESQEKWVRHPRERYHWPLAAAIVLLLIEIFYSERKAPSRQTQSNLKPAKAVAALLVLLLPLVGMASPASALREYNAGKFDRALEEYERSLQKNSDDPRLHFNAGTAAYRNQKLEEAAKHFEQTLAAPDLKLQEQAYYNLGNTLYQLGEQSPDPSGRTAKWEDAINRYESSLKLNPQDPDARFNLDYVKKRLEELKQQQQQQQNQDSDQKDQQKDQQNNQQDQSKEDQEKDSKDQPQDQKQNSEKQDQQQQQDQKQDQSKSSPDQKNQQADQQKPQRAPAQQKPEDAETGQPEAEAKYAPGQMTPEQAKQLLEAQKGDEQMIPIQPETKRIPANGPVKDW